MPGGAAANRLRVPVAEAAKRVQGAGLFLRMLPGSRTLEGGAGSAVEEGNAHFQPLIRAQRSAPDKETPEGRAADRQTHLGPSEACPNPARSLPARASSASAHRASVSGTKSPLHTSQTALHTHIPWGQLSGLTRPPSHTTGREIAALQFLGRAGRQKEIARCGASDPGRPHPETAAPARLPLLHQL